MKKKLAIIGGSYLQLPIVKKAMAMGIETYCFSWRDGAVCADVADHFYPISIIEKDEILKKCQEVGIDGITTIASDTAVLTVNYVASRMGLRSNPEEYSEVTTNKYKMRQCFLDNDVPSPKFTLVEDLAHYQITGFKFPLIVKPTDRSGSRGVEKVLDPVQLEEAIIRAQNESFEHKAIIEEFVTGREISVESISNEGKHTILQITDKVTTGAPFFVELEHHQPSSLPDDIKRRVKEIVLHALDALHIQYGASHSELKITEDGDIKVIEIGARMGGDFIGSDLVRLSTGYDFLKGVIEVALGEYNSPVLSESNHSGVYFLSKETSYLRPIIQNCANYPEIVDALITRKELRSIECSDDRSGYLIYKSDSIFKPQIIEHNNMENVKGKKLLVMAGNYVHSKIVEAAKDQGVYTIVTDYLDPKDSPAKLVADEYWNLSTGEIDTVVERCRKEHVDGVLNFCIDTIQGQYISICEKLGVPCYGTKEQLDIMTNKRKFKDFCKKHGVEVVPEYSLSDIENDKVTYPILVKPTDNRGSIGQTVCFKKEDVKNAVEFACKSSKDGNCLIERYMSGLQDMGLAYIVIDGTPYLLKISDRYVGKMEDGYDRQHIASVLPSRFAGAYVEKVQPNVIKMIKALGIKFGVAFLQGFYEDGHVYMYDPGLRFPGSDFDIVLKQATGFDSMSSFVQFALTGDVKSCVGNPTGAYKYNGKCCFIMSVAVRAGKIASITGMEEISKRDGVFSSALWHHEGDVVYASGDVKQRAAEFCCLFPDRYAISEFVDYVYKTLKITDEHGKDMIMSKLDINRVY